jgi:hypothetical protein
VPLADVLARQSFDDGAAQEFESHTAESASNA